MIPCGPCPCPCLRNRIDQWLVSNLRNDRGETLSHACHLLTAVGAAQTRQRRQSTAQPLDAWPEFLIGREWVAVGELFDGVAGGGEAFSNRGGETLFDAVARVGVDWSGSVSCGAQGGMVCDLSTQVLVDLGYFDSRDELFERHGQTLCRPAHVFLEPVLGRWSAGARLPASTGYRQ
ncbi:hypothetical protein [Streptomyces sp. NBC_00286]|uniref:hypothetical protein n=1 Tax=Streptomyces sp. NBC_00286 TaxID=2975701 RepID=UPI002E2CF598|nr:hypothetical protein [Streptomyces sp. NBC_00286]